MIASNKPASSLPRKNIYNPMSDPSRCHGFLPRANDYQTELSPYQKRLLVLEEFRHSSALLASFAEEYIPGPFLSRDFLKELGQELEKQREALCALWEMVEKIC